MNDRVSANCDTDNDGFLSEAEIANVTEIYVSSEHISSLAGIENFLQLQKLDCCVNQLTTLDVSSNTALKYLECSNNDLTALNVSKNSALTDLYCFSNDLTTLDVSGNIALKNLRCNSNKLTNLDVSNNTELRILDCGDNLLTTLDVSKNTRLYDLGCYSNDLTTLDVRSNTALETLQCNANKLITLDVSNNTALTSLSCYRNNLTSLDVSKNALYSLYCSRNEYMVYANPDRTFDLSTLPGSFDVSKAGGWTGGTVSGNILTFDEESSTVTYTYDCGSSNSGIEDPTFTLNLHEHNYGAWEPNENDTHTRSCLTEGCGFSEIENCYGGTATVTERAICEVCGQPYGNLASQAVISGTNITGKVGNEITVDLNLDENPGLVSMMVEVDYDKDVLEYKGASNGDVFPTDSFLPPNESEDDGKVLSWQNSALKENINTTGKLATLTFRIKESAPAGETSIGFICDKSQNEALNVLGESIAVVTNAAKVNVINFYYGDVDNNDRVDAADVFYLRRYLAKWKNYTNIPLNAVDLDADGKVTIRDLTILERHIAGWNGYETLPVLDAQLPVA